MYGIVNRAIEELVISTFGKEKWIAVKIYAGIDIDFFASSAPYDDEVTYQLAKAVCEVCNMEMRDVMVAFGKFWILKTGKEKYNDLMKSGGNNFKEFIINLPNFHNRVSLYYPNLMPPEFKVSDVNENNLKLHYHSKREGFQDFVMGLILGLGEYFDMVVTAELLQNRLDGFDHEVYLIKW